MRKNNKYIQLTALLVSALLVCASCASDTLVSQEVLSQKKVSSKKIPITVLVKYAFSINGFEKAVEEKFPNIDIIQVGNYTANMGKSEYASRLEHNDLTDIVMTWPMDVGEEYFKDRLMDLSGMEFTGRYNISMLNNMEKDGALYYLPGPSQIRGIIYNKTLFKTMGWEVPSDFEGFIKLCNEIESSGIKSLQLGFENKEVLDTAFVGYNYGNFFSTPKDAQWIEEYNNGVGSFGDHFAPALDVFQRFIDEGIFEKSDLQVSYSKREQMLFSRECAMVEDSVILARMGESVTGTQDEFALMPFFNDAENSDWARIYMVCFIGLSKELEKAENKEKYEAVLEIMDYISTEEGQIALASDTGGMFSSLSKMSAPDVPEIADMVEALNGGRYAVFPELKNAQGALRDALAGMVEGKLTKEQAIAMVDKQNLDPPKSEVVEVFGYATKDFSLIETGSYIANMISVWAESDIGLILDNGKDGKFNGKGISSRIYEGEITTIDIERLLPDFKRDEKGLIWKTEVKGSDLLDILEYSVAAEGNTGWFYYTSGLKITMDPTAEPGSRIKKVTTLDGAEIDKDKIYTVATTENSIPEDKMILSKKVVTDMTLEKLLIDDIKAKGEISPAEDVKENFVITN